jgi:nitroreductase
MGPITNWAGKSVIHTISFHKKENLMNAKRIKKETTEITISGDPANLQSLQPIVLLKPKFECGESVQKALEQRKTVREISDKKLSLQTLSNLLWAAAGVNRDTGPFGIPGRTAATASNSQEIDLYVALEEGVYFYDAFQHKLMPVIAGDQRILAIGHGQAGFGDKAPVRLIYVADIHKLSHTSGYQEPGLQDPEVQKSYYFVDTGLMAGNVYLFAASEGLAAWFHNCDKARLAAKLTLNADQRVLFGQTVGYPV